MQDPGHRGARADTGPHPLPHVREIDLALAGAPLGAHWRSNRRALWNALAKKAVSPLDKNDISQ